MKNLKLFILVAFALLLAKPAFALQCKAGNSQGASDECWTEVRISSAETTPVVRGTVLVYENASDSSGDNAFEARVVPASASQDSARVAGVAQTMIATGDTGRILVRGLGAVRSATTGVSTGDLLFANGNSAGHVTKNAGSSRDKAIAWATQSSTAKATIDAFIVVV